MKCDRGKAQNRNYCITEMRVYASVSCSFFFKGRLLSVSLIGKKGRKPEKGCKSDVSFTLVFFFILNPAYTESIFPAVGCATVTLEYCVHLHSLEGLLQFH